MTPTLEKPEEMQTLLDWFAQTADNPRAQLEAALARGEKAVGCLPYFAPEELIHAMGMRPFGLWGTGELSCSFSAGYFPPFYCSLAPAGCPAGPVPGWCGPGSSKRAGNTRR